MNVLRSTLPLLLSGVLLGLPACDSSSGGPLGPGSGTATVSGSIEPTGADSFAPAAAVSGDQAATSGPGATSVYGGVSTVVIGELRSNGTLEVLAEAEVDAEGRFRIEGVPAHRAELLIRALADGGAVVGSAVLHEETVPGGHHRAQPIGLRSSLHAEVWIRARTAGGPAHGMGSAEIALFLHAGADAGLPPAPAAAEIDALAQASIRAGQAITAVLAAEGIQLDAAARNSLLLALAAKRDEERDAGADPDATQDAYLAASASALIASGVSAEALALAAAAATTAFDAALASGVEAAVRSVPIRQGLLLNIAARKAVLASVSGSAASQAAAASSVLAQLEGEVRATPHVNGLRSALVSAEASIENQIVASVLAGIPEVIPGSVRLVVEGALVQAFAAVDFAATLHGAATAEAKAQAVKEFRAAVEAAVAELLSQVPEGAAVGLTAEAAARLLLAACASPVIG